MATAAFCHELDFRGPIVPFSLLKKFKVSLGAKNVFALIASYRRGGRSCFASPKWFADEMGVSESSVRNYIKNLIEAGLIRKDENGCYHVIWDALSDSSTPAPSPAENNFYKGELKICGDKCKICGIYNKINTKSKKLPLSPSSPLPSSAPAARGVSFSSGKDAPRSAGASRQDSQAEEAFAQVWKAYPRPPRFVSRQKAWSEFQKLHKQGVLPDLKTILAAIEINRKHNPAWSPDNENGRYIPNLESWLSGRRWLDDFAGSPMPPAPTAEQAALAAQVAAIEKQAQTWGNASPEQIRAFQALEKRVGPVDETKRSMAFGIFRFLDLRGSIPLPPPETRDLLAFLKTAVRKEARR